mmetsp:Transcript_31832/g.52464  ORF Transcript_31832/g.52464 Transcript_31832/m.52464 type:complete len:293 (+) Transcript_31832:504-1382(+)
MHIRLGGNPRGGVDGTSQSFVVQILPLNGQSDGIFGFNVLGMRYSGRASRRDTNRTSNARQGPLREINVMGIEIVRNIGRLTSPRPEGIELMFGLRHVGIEVLKVAQTGPSTIASIGIERIETFVNFHSHQDVIFFGSLGQHLVMLQGLNNWLGYHHVHAAVDAFQSNIEVRIIGSENDSHITLFVGSSGGDKGLGADFIISRESVACQIHISIDISDILLHVLTNSRKFLAIYTTHTNMIDLGASTKIKHGQGHDSSSLVAVGGSPTDVSCCVLASAHHKHVYFRSIRHVD